MTIATSTGKGSLKPSQATMTVGDALHTSPAVDAAVRALVDEVKAASAKVTAVKPGVPELRETFEGLLGRATQARGRALLYPYLGSGVGNGPLVELADGSVKWDMICGIGVNFFGHSDADLVEASIRGGIDDVLKHGNLTSNFEAYHFGETLLAEASRGSRLRHAYLATGGAMANENALKLCMQRLSMRPLEIGDPAKLLASHAPTPRVFAFKDCFMGRSMMMASIGDNHAGREGLPIVADVDYVPFWDAVAAERMGGKRKYIDWVMSRVIETTERYPGAHACFIFELVQGEGGFNVGDRDYFKTLMDFCHSRKIAVWDDEIQTFGRLPSMFAFEHFDLGDYVDVLTVGKMTQACATLWTETQPMLELTSLGSRIRLPPT